MKRIAICLALSTLPSCGGEATDTSAAVAAGSGESHENSGADPQEGSHADENDEPTNAEAAAAVAGEAAAEADFATTDSGPSRHGALELHPGFMPDPVITEGLAGGTQHARTLNESCTGWVEDVPNHVLVTTGAMAELRVVAHAEEDITLVIRRPDGSFVCNDDAEGTRGTDPMVRAEMPSGEHQIWVGANREGEHPSYRLGFSELPNVMPASLIVEPPPAQR